MISVLKPGFLSVCVILFGEWECSDVIQGNEWYLRRNVPLLYLCMHIFKDGNDNPPQL
jgi:hypothetical protein